MMSVALRNLFLAAVGLFLALPLIIVAGISVNQGQQLSFPPKGFSLGWYAAVFVENDWRNALLWLCTFLGLFHFATIPHKESASKNNSFPNIRNPQAGLVNDSLRAASSGLEGFSARRSSWRPSTAATVRERAS